MQIKSEILKIIEIIWSRDVEEVFNQLDLLGEMRETKLTPGYSIPGMDWPCKDSKPNTHDKVSFFDPDFKMIFEQAKVLD